MKRKCLILCLVLFSMLCANSKAYAADAVFELKELNMTIAIPEGWYTITRDTPATDPIFTQLGVDGNTLLEYLNQNKIYLNAISKSPLEIVVTKIDNDDIKKVYDLNSLSESKVKELSDSLINSEDAKKAGITYNGYSLFSHPQAKFVVLDFFQNANGSTAYGEQYLTVINGSMINITVHSYGGKLTDSQKSLIQSVVKNVTFTQVNKKPGFQLNFGSMLAAGLRGALIAGGVTLILLLIRNAKNKKAKKAE